MLARGRVVELSADLLAGRLDDLLGAGAVEEDNDLLSDGDTARSAERVQSRAHELEIELVFEDSAACEDGKVAEDGLAVVVEAGCLDCRDLELAAEPVEDVRGERLAVSVLGDEQGATASSEGMTSWRSEIVSERKMDGFSNSAFCVLTLVITHGEM